MGTQPFDLMIQIRDGLQSGNPPTPAQMDAVSATLDNVTEKGGKVGSLLNSLMSNEVHLSEQRIQLLALLSVQQDTDVAEAILKLKHEEIMLNAALNTAALIIPKSLLDFLR